MKTIYLKHSFDIFNFEHIRLLKYCERLAFNMMKQVNEQVRVLIGIENHDQYIQSIDERYMSVLEMVQLLGQRGVFIAVIPECPEIDTHEFYVEKEIIKRICVGEYTIPELCIELNNYELYTDNITKIVNNIITNIEIKSYDVIN